MFDLSFTELMLVGVVALVVIGPEKLPKVARTVGHLLGRAQRYVSDVKGDIQREVELDELRKMKEEMESAAQSVKGSFAKTEASLKKELSTSADELTSLESDLKSDYEPSLPGTTTSKPGIAKTDASGSENSVSADQINQDADGVPAAQAIGGFDTVPSSGASVKSAPAQSTPQSSPSGAESKT